MPPKGTSTEKDQLVGDDEVLQAVILADSFNKRFRPLTTETPRVGKRVGPADPVNHVADSDLVSAPRLQRAIAGLDI